MLIFSVLPEPDSQWSSKSPGDQPQQPEVIWKRPTGAVVDQFAAPVRARQTGNRSYRGQVLIHHPFRSNCLCWPHQCHQHGSIDGYGDGYGYDDAYGDTYSCNNHRWALQNLEVLVCSYNLWISAVSLSFPLFQVAMVAASTLTPASSPFFSSLSSSFLSTCLYKYKILNCLACSDQQYVFWTLT